jgi:UPF0176 protein
MATGSTTVRDAGRYRPIGAIEKRADLPVYGGMYTVAAFYKFTPLAHREKLRGPLLDLCRTEGVRGTILLAEEGINGTIAGTREGIDRTLGHIRGLAGCADLEWKESSAAELPFGRIKVRLKAEIVSMGQPHVDPTAAVGHYVHPSDWNTLIGAPDVAVIDTRNNYEVAIGTFDGAINPNTDRFRDFPTWWQANGDRFVGKRIAMFCTGGIRCEKSTNYLISQGVDAVFHLKGGILKYLEDVPPEKSLWSGECFVFDQRVSVGHGLRPGGYETCHACRRPLSHEDIARPDYEEGVRCFRCADEFDEAQRQRFRERHRQMQIAKARGLRHLGQRMEPNNSR